MIQFADPSIPEFLSRCKAWGNGDQETEAAIAKCEAGESGQPLPPLGDFLIAGQKVLREFDEFLAR